MISDACRVDASVLCSVGDHGRILISRDNGRSWSVVRGENRGTAILFVANDPTSVAWSLLGSEAWRNATEWRCWCEGRLRDRFTASSP